MGLLQYLSRIVKVPSHNLISYKMQIQENDHSKSDNEDQQGKADVEEMEEEGKEKRQIKEEREDKEEKEEKEDDKDDDDDDKKRKKDKKKKKSKRHHKEEDKEQELEKYNEAVKTSFLHTVQALTPQERQKYAEVENDPMKLICTNLPLKITTEEIESFFNTAISTSNPELATPPPIKDVEFDKFRTFAIMELSQRRIKDYFRSHQAFNYAPGQTTFKVMRPKEFFEDKYGDKSKQEAVGPGERLYIGGLPHYFTEEQVRKICETFGKLKYITLIKENGTSKGYGFFEYQDAKGTEKALQALNNLPVADRRLKCTKATMGGGRNASSAYVPTAALSGVDGAPSKPANHAGSYLLSYQNIEDPYIQRTLNNNPDCKVPSRVVQFLNMFDPEDLFDEQTFQDLKADLQEECAKYGPIDKIVISRPDPTCGYSVPTVGKAFVKFMYIIAAKRARVTIAGKIYNKRTVITSFYPEEKFNSREYLVTL